MNYKEENKKKINYLEIVKLIIESNSVSLRDVDNGEEPFLYSSGNRGPGYVMIKGLCGMPNILKYLCEQLSYKIYNVINSKDCDYKIDCINGNATGGIICGWEIADNLAKLCDYPINFMYYRGNKKNEGHNEEVVGINYVKPKSNVIVVEELVNYAKTTMDAVNHLRNNNNVQYAACLLSYDHNDVNTMLKNNSVDIISLITLPKLLQIAEDNGLIKKNIINSYKKYLNNPVKWQLDRGYVIPEESAKNAMTQGYNMKKLSSLEAIKLGAPKTKIDEGIIYYKV